MAALHATPTVPDMDGYSQIETRGATSLQTATPTAQAPIRVGLVDDHAPLRGAVRALLSAEVDLEVAGEAETIAEALRLVGAKPPLDVLVLDLGLPDGVSLESIRALLDRGGPGLAIVVLTMHDEPGFRTGALTAGASAYLLKDSPPDALIAAVRAGAGRGDAV